MNNVLILILVFSMVFSFVTPLMAYGEESNEKLLEGVILKVKELFDISNDYDGFVSRVNSYNNEMNFFLNWTDSKEKLPDISVHTDYKGNIISFDKYEQNYKEPTTKLPSISKDEALKFALEFIFKVDPTIYKEIKLKESSNPINTWDKNYSFNFIRVINDIPYTENTIYVNVDMNTGDITNYYTNWERDLEFPKAESIISLEKAKESYIKDIGLKLVYKTNYRNPRPMDSGGESKYYLAYSYIGERKGIDAKTGEPINLSSNIIYGAGNLKTMAEDSVAGGAPVITPEERGEIDKLVGIKDIKEVEKKAREILKLDSNYKLQNHNLYTNWQNPDEFFYNLSFIKDTKERNYSVDISLDAKTLDLISFYKSRDIDSSSKATINKEEALKLAKDYINKINSDKIDKIEYIENTSADNQPYFYFNFIRKVDDIYVESDNISIGIDAVNKDINSYNISWYKGEFPSREKTISIDKAHEILFDKIGFNLNYISIYNNEKPEDKKDVKLVYFVSQDKPTIIDAKTGDILDYSGKPYKENKIPSYTDIEDSYAKDKINTLSEYSIGFSTDKFNPKDKIKQKDFLYLLWKSVNPYRTETEADSDVIYKELTRQNIIKAEEENRERVVNKEEAVKFVIRAMKYEKLAEISNIYKDLFKDQKDISPNLKGHMSIAYGLKLINVDGSGFINPKYELLREDAASMIFEFMFN